MDDYGLKTIKLLRSVNVCLLRSEAPVRET